MSPNKVLPPVYFLGALGGAVVLHYVVPFVAVIPRPWHLAGGVLVAVGLAFIVVPARTFQTKGTAIKPFERSSLLITDGFYAITRNPMYLGMVLAVTGDAAPRRSPICCACSPGSSTAESFHSIRGAGSGPGFWRRLSFLSGAGAKVVMKLSSNKQLQRTGSGFVICAGGSQ